MSILFIRINCPDDLCAINIGETLIKERLVGCINIEGPVESVYFWDDEIEREEEYVLIAKAPEENWTAIEQKVIELHPFETPAIVAFPCVHANARYAEWIKDNTKTLK